MSQHNWLKDGEYFVYAEHYPGLFGFAYRGWWLYAAPIVGEEVKKEESVWLNCDWELDAILSGVGITKPLSYKGNRHSEYTDAFREKYPVGVRCRAEGFGYACKVDIICN